MKFPRRGDVMKFEITVLTMDGVMQISQSNDWPTRNDLEEFMLNHTPAGEISSSGKETKPYQVFEWTHINAVNGTYFWNSKPARVWGVGSISLSASLDHPLQENHLAKELEGVEDRTVFGPVLIAVVV